MPHKDPEARRLYNKKYHAEHYRNNKQSIIKKNAVYKKAGIRRNQEFVNNYKASQSCERCGESDPHCLLFHHLKDKEWNVGDMIGRAHSLEKIAKEIEKCIVLCFNCHAKEHRGG